MKILLRESSILDGDKNMEELFRLKNFPIYMDVTSQEGKEDSFHDMIYEINVKNGEVQIGELIPEKELYQNAHYNNVGDGWRCHHQAFAEFIAKYDPEKIFEIGGGRGILSVEYSRLRDSDWTILDPVPNPVPECRAQYIKGFFDSQYQVERGYDAVIHTHTLEHFYDPVQCIKNIARNMDENSWMFFSIPNMEEMIKRCYTNVMNFEHTYYCAEPYVTYICNQCGFDIVDTKCFKEDHSIFYAAKKVDGEIKRICLQDEYCRNRKLFMDWKTEQEKVVKHFNSRIQKYLSDRKVYIFGAHVNTQFLLAFGLQADRIEGVIDNDPAKWGGRLYGTSFKVYSPEILKNQSLPIIILRSGTHNDEIKEGILKVNCKTEIWEEPIS